MTPCNQAIKPKEKKDLTTVSELVCHQQAKNLKGYLPLAPKSNKISNKEVHIEISKWISNLQCKIKNEEDQRIELKVLRKVNLLVWKGLQIK